MPRIIKTHIPIPLVNVTAKTNLRTARSQEKLHEKHPEKQADQKKKGKLKDVSLFGHRPNIIHQIEKLQITFNSSNIGNMLRNTSANLPDPLVDLDFEQALPKVQTLLENHAEKLADKKMEGSI